MKSRASHDTDSVSLSLRWISPSTTSFIEPFAARSTVSLPPVSAIAAETGPMLSITWGVMLRKEIAADRSTDALQENGPTFQVLLPRFRAGLARDACARPCDLAGAGVSSAKTYSRAPSLR